MSETSAALEAAVAEVLAHTPTDGIAPTPRQRVAADRAFARVLKIIAPRIRHFIRQYGLSGHWDDAEQCCAIGVHRAIQAYDPTKAQFTTFVNWQLRGELQSLRFRVMTDQRPSARRMEATTISLNAMHMSEHGEAMSIENLIEDETALDMAESGASEHMAIQTREALLDAYVERLRATGVEQLKRRARSERTKQSDPSLPRFRARSGVDPAAMAELEQRLAQQRAVIERRLKDDAGEGSDDPGERERQRQVAKRAARAISEIAQADPRFHGVLGQRRAGRRTSPAQPARTPMLPDPAAPHNVMAKVVVIDPSELAWQADDAARIDMTPHDGTVRRLH